MPRETDSRAKAVAYAGLGCLKAMVLLLIASFATPSTVLNDIKLSFLDAKKGATTLHFGIFGLSKSTHVGWYFPAEILGYDTSSLNSGTAHHLTHALILMPIAAGIASLAFICLCFGPGCGVVSMTIFAGVGATLALSGWVSASVLFGRHAKASLKANGWDAHYGDAFWMAMAAWIILGVIFGLMVSGPCWHYSSSRRR